SVPIGEYDHKGGTSSHRAPECSGTWSTPSDIWSLGCTFYETAFRCNLFSQLSVNTSTLHDEWKSIYPSESPDVGGEYETKYIERSEKFCSATSNKLLDDLIIRTLNPNPKIRYTIDDVL